MSNSLSPNIAPRVLFMGMSGNFSPPSLLALLESGIEVCAVVLPARVRDAALPAIRRVEPPAKARALLPVLQSSLHTSIANIAWEHSIPVWEVQRMSSPETCAVYSSYAPDAYCVACFSLYIPRGILDIPRLGCLNVHPSLLPLNRGPDPLFWIFRNGDRQTGVTIHMMDEGLDSGPIIAQEHIDIPDGITYTRLEAHSAELGGRLLARSVWELYRGTAQLAPQDESRSSYLPMPSGENYVVPVAEWTARRVYNFVRGVASHGELVTLLIDGQRVRVLDAISYSHMNTDNTTPDAINAKHLQMPVTCLDGQVVVLTDEQPI